MSQISLKSISGITSITTSTGVDNQLTLHTNNTTQAFKLDHAGNLHFNNHVNTTGISTASNFKTGTTDLHSLGLTAASADIDDFVSVGSNIHLGNAGIITASSYRGDGSQLTGIAAGLSTISGVVNVANDLDVDGHTNLDNVSIAGVTTGRGELRLTEGTSDVSQGAEIGSLMFLNPSNDNKNAKIAALRTTGTSGADLAFYTRTHGDATNDDGGVEKLRITSGGLVGVGQASPTHMLHVDSSNASDSTATAFFKGRIIRFDGAASAHSPRLNLSLDGTDKATILLHRTNDDLEIQTLTASPIRFSPNSTERLRIASDGDTTISASASANFLPGAALNVISDKNVNSGLDDKVNYHLALANPNNDTNEAIGIAFGITDTSTKVGAAIVHQRDAAGSQGHMKFYTRPNNAGPPVERVRIRADGNFYVNSSNNSIVGQPSFYASNNDGCGSYRPHSGFPIHHFYSNAGGTYSLESYVNGNGSYVNLSDYRLKENIVSISNGIDIVKQLNPVKFDWKSSSKTKNDLGFIAHEVQTLIPTAVDGTKDQMKEDGSPFYQGIAQTKMIPYLTAALKEAITKIEKLEQDNIALRVRVTNLEGN